MLVCFPGYGFSHLDTKRILLMGFSCIENEVTDTKELLLSLRFHADILQQDVAYVTFEPSSSYVTAVIYLISRVIYLISEVIYLISCFIYLILNIIYLKPKVIYLRKFSNKKRVGYPSLDNQLSYQYIHFTTIH